MVLHAISYYNGPRYNNTIQQYCIPRRIENCKNDQNLNNKKTRYIAPTGGRLSVYWTNENWECTAGWCARMEMKTIISIWSAHNHRNYPPSTGDVTVLLVQLIQFSSPPESHNLGLDALSGKTSYRQISWSLEAARFGFRLLHSPWNLTGTSAAALQISERCDNSNIQSRGFETSRDLVVNGLSE